VLKKYFLSAALIWTCSILLLCLEPASDLPKIEINHVDKMVHFSFHFVFVLLWYLYFNTNAKNRNYKTPVMLFLVSSVFGIVIELFQHTFTTTRKADVLDVFSNISGAFAALILLLSIGYYSKKRILLNKKRT